MYRQGVYVGGGSFVTASMRHNKVLEVSTVVCRDRGHAASALEPCAPCHSDDCLWLACVPYTLLDSDINLIGQWLFTIV